MKKKTIYVCLIVICIVLSLMLWTMMHFSPVVHENMISDNLGTGIVMADPPVPTINSNPSASTNIISSLGTMINSCFDNHTGNMTSECQNQINGLANTISSGISSITNVKKSDITGHGSEILQKLNS